MITPHLEQQKVFQEERQASQCFRKRRRAICGMGSEATTPQFRQEARRQKGRSVSNSMSKIGPGTWSGLAFD
jgi:hypothetical protein